MKIIAFFNNKGGVGRTTLVYHLAWMYADLGFSVVVADLDPQANLTAMFLAEDALESLWPEGGPSRTILAPLKPLLDGAGGIAEPYIEDVGGIGLLAGDLSLSGVEDELGRQWLYCLEGKARAFRITGSFHQVLVRAAQMRVAEIVLVDVGANLGAINRAALLAADHVVIPVAPDLFSLKSLQNLGSHLRDWRSGWAERMKKKPVGLDVPRGLMEPLGYILMRRAVWLDRSGKADERWMSRIPEAYRESVLGELTPQPGAVIDQDPHCLSTLKHYRSLMPLAQEARKPMFHLTPADGAIGGHAKAVHECYNDFSFLASEIAQRAGAL